MLLKGQRRQLRKLNGFIFAFILISSPIAILIANVGEGRASAVIHSGSVVVRINFRPLLPLNGTAFSPGEAFDLVVYSAYNSNGMADVLISVLDLETMKEVGHYHGYIERGYGVEGYYHVRLKAPQREGSWKLLVIVSCIGRTFPEWQWILTYFVMQKAISTTTVTTVNLTTTSQTTTSLSVTSISETTKGITSAQLLSDSIKQSFEASTALLLILTALVAGLGGYLAGRRIKLRSAQQTRMHHW